jgi:hypothetical protein
MSQTLTALKKAIKNTPGTGELAQVSELNDAFDKFDNNFVPACKIRNSATQVIATGTPTDLQYNATAFDSFAARSEGPMADLSNDRIQIRKAGVYIVKANSWITTVSAVGVMRMDLRINGAATKVCQEIATNTIITQDVWDIMLLAVNDLITCNVNQTSGANRNYSDNTLPNGFELSAVWLGSIIEV